MSTLSPIIRGDTSLACSPQQPRLPTPRPQAAAQGFLVAQLEPGDQSWLMIASIVGSIVSIAYLVATTELDSDTTLHCRTNYPEIHGYMGKGAVQEGSVVLGIVLFVGGVLGAKLVALVMLAGGSMAVAAAWCTAEAGLLFALRYVRGGHHGGAFRHQH